MRVRVSGCVHPLQHRRERVGKKKELACNCLQASSAVLNPYVNLVPIIVTMTVVASVAVSIGPIV